MDITINPFSIIPNGSIYTIVPYGAPFAHAQKQQYDCDSARPRHSRFYGGIEIRNGKPRFTEVRDIDSPAPLSGDEM